MNYGFNAIQTYEHGLKQEVALHLFLLLLTPFILKLCWERVNSTNLPVMAIIGWFTLVMCLKTSGAPWTSATNRSPTHLSLFNYRPKTVGLRLRDTELKPVGLISIVSRVPLCVPTLGCYLAFITAWLITRYNYPTLCFPFCWSNSRLISGDCT